MSFFLENAPFYVQEHPRGVWHIETPDNPELMLCGAIISVDLVTSKVQRRPGTKPCLWCRHKVMEFLRSVESMPSYSTKQKTLAKESMNRILGGTTSSGDES